MTDVKLPIKIENEIKWSNQLGTIFLIFSVFNLVFFFFGSFFLINDTSIPLYFPLFPMLFGLFSLSMFKYFSIDKEKKAENLDSWMEYDKLS